MNQTYQLHYSTMEAICQKEQRILRGEIVNCLKSKLMQVQEIELG